MATEGKDFSTLVELLRFRAHQTPQGLAYTYLREGVHADQAYTYAELDHAARAIAVALSSTSPARGDRALLLYPPGLDFIAAFFGCLYAGMVPIPAPPPDGARLKRTFPRLRGILDDAGARLIVSTGAICDNASRLAEDDTPWLCSDRVDPALAATWQAPLVAGADLAYLQYTSGSTSAPKGVMLTHASVLRNLALSQVAWAYTADSVAVTWMPYFHDYGLVDGLLQPLYSGIPCYVMSPLTFVKRPQRWLEAIARYRGTHTQAPNFAYELCLDRITPAQRDALDLSCLRVASNGAEPLRADTFRRFVDYFASAGFSPRAYYPAYGLAEATLLVSTKPPGDVLRICRADPAVLENARRYLDAAPGAPARSIVSCGRPLGDLNLAIVDPHSRRRLEPRDIGEIWVADASVASGYWGQPADSAAVFGVPIEGEAGATGYLRTGDLGFMLDGELYVTGRLKDLVIIDGVNHYPQDIEWTVQRSHAELRPDHCAAFAVQIDGAERLVVVAEARNLLDDWSALFDAVRRAVADTHELDLHAFVVLRKGGILKTSSGKLQRSNCRVAYLDGSLSMLAQWEKPRVAATIAAAPAAAVPVAGSERIAQWLIQALAARLELPADSIDPQAPFASYGLTSRIGVELVGELEQWLGHDNLSPTLLWEHPSVAALCAHLARGGMAAPEADVTASTTQAGAGASPSPVAIIGMACRLPSAASPEQFWDNLLNKREAITSLPDGRWRGAGIAVEQGVGPGRVTTLRAGFVDGVERFDAGLFGIGAREADIMDPQQRMLLEVTWETIERAGLNADALAGSDTGVYVGISTDDYSAWQFGDARAISAYTGPAKALSIAANRISYQFDLLGPSMAIDTACSSSLVAIHQASAALQRGECALALAGGVNLLLAPQMSIALSQAGMLAPDGRCKTFDAAADGYVRGEGCVMFMLKRLDDALRDGDTIAAVIRGSAVNQDGRSNGLTAPNGLAQQRVLRQALAAAGVDGAAIGYVETHGTGTALGDPIEVNALQAVLAPGRAPGQSCALGALKANIGHLEAAAGAAGLMKAVLSLQHGELAPHPTLTVLNPLISLDDALRVPTERAPWTGAQRLAGVSAFGFGGTNAHMVLEAAPAPLAPPAPVSLAPERDLHLLTLSARDQDGLRALAGSWIGALGRDDGATLAERCFAANTGRARLPERLALSAPDPAGMVAALTEWLQDQPGAWQAGTAPNRAPRIGFLFTGQGAQYVGMGRALYRSEPGFKRDIDACDALLQGTLQPGLLELLYPQESTPETQALLARTDLTQPALFALEYALARLWISWGVAPSALLGHSIGEYVAAALAGVFTLADGLRLVAERARLMQQAPGDGAMAAVLADADTCRAALQGEDEVVIAVYNSPGNHVLSGRRAALERVLARLGAQGIEARPLNVSHAFHSPLMAPAAALFADAAARLTYQAPSLPIFSNLTGAVAGPELATAAYWVDHLRQPVRFAQGLAAMRASGIDVFIEIGPRATLLALGRQTVTQDDVLWLPSLRPQSPDDQILLNSLGALHVRGAAPDWRAVDGHQARRRVAVPTYPFQGRRHWLPAVPQAGTGAGVATVAMPGKRTSSPLLGQTLFENRYDTQTFPLLAEHRVFDQVVVPGAAHLSLVLEACASFFGAAPCALHDVIFAQALVIPEPGARRIELAIARDAGPDGRAFNLISLPEGTLDDLDDEADWSQHASGRVAPREANVPGFEDHEPLDTLQRRCGAPLERDFYTEVWQPAIGLGPQLRWVDRVWRADGEVLARLVTPVQAGGHGYRLHPGLIDSMLQVLTAAVDSAPGEALVPFSFESFHWLGQGAPGSPLWSHIRLRPQQPSAQEVLSDVNLYGADGALVAQARGFRARRVASASLLPVRANKIEKTPTLADAVHALRWDDAPAGTAPLAGPCLLIGAQPAALATLAAALGTHTTVLQAITGTPTPGAGDPSAGQIYLPFEDAPALQQALQALGPLGSVCYLAPLSNAPQFDAALDGSVAALHLMQALVGLAGAPRFILLSSDAQVLQLRGAPRADQAALWGLARVLRLEHPELACRCIDLDSADADPVGVVKALLNGGADLALRGGRLLAPLLERIELKPADGASLDGAAVRADCAYLVSGGLGALGLRLADWLAGQGARQLLLLGRRAPGAEALARIAALRAQGVTVLTRALDIADAAALDAALHETAGALPRIAGVFHLAGVLDDGMLLQQGRGHYANVFRPKLGGALNLERAFAAAALEHFVCFSSVAALTGSMGQGAYAAANAALDALMAARRAAGKPGRSIQWGPWAEAGMAAQQDERERQRFTAYGIAPIAPQAGMALLGALSSGDAWLAGTDGTPAVLAVHWPTYLEQLYGAAVPGMYRALQSAAVKSVAATPAVAAGVAAGGLAERLVQAEPKARRPLLEQQLQQAVAAVLGLGKAPIGPRERLFELGLDSLGAVELRNRLVALLGRALRATLLFDYPTLSALADHIEHDVLGFAAAGEPPPAVEQTADSLDHLSDDELARLLAAELG